MFETRVAVVTAANAGDRYSYDRPDWKNTTEVEVPFGVEFQPLSTATDDENGRRLLVTSGYRLICPPRKFIDIKPGQRIRVGDRLYDLVGEAKSWNHHSHGHTTLTLEAVNG